MKPREPDLVGKKFSDDAGIPLNGEYFLKIPDKNMPTGFRKTTYNYRQGKIHGSPAVIYPDGQEERWEHGNFMEITALPYQKR